MFEGNKSYRNRYGDTYEFVKQSATRYKFVMDGTSMDYHRFGGKDGEQGINMNDLGMFDPSGGPYICLGTKVDDKPIVKIAYCDEHYIVDVEQ